jgi:hypothetical protein
MKAPLVLTGVVVALVLVSTVEAYALGRELTVRPGDSASFTYRGQLGWWCHKYAARERWSGGRSHVFCVVGDQTPNVSLLFGRKALTVEVEASAEHTRVRKIRRRVCAEPGRCWFQDTWRFSGGAGR